MRRPDTRCTTSKTIPMTNSTQATTFLARIPTCLPPWFGHYLKNEPAPSWIAEGVRYIDRERELNLLKANKPKT